MTAPAPARINPVPEVILNGVKMGIAPAQGSKVYARRNTVAILDDLSATWGRQELFDHHRAQTARFRLYVGADQPSWAWQDYRGKPVVFQWTWPTINDGKPVVFFRGKVRIQRTTAAPLNARDGADVATIVDFTCDGRLTELGNRKTGNEQWPAEGGTARMARIRALAGTSISGITFRDYWKDAPFSARQVKGTDALSLLESFFDSCGGDRMVYRADTDTITWMGRRSLRQNGQHRRAFLQRDPTSGLIQAKALQAGNAWPMISGRELESAGTMTRTAEGGVTRLEYTWTDSTGTTLSGGVYDAAKEAAQGVSQFSLATEYAQQNWAEVAGRDWIDTMWSEGALPQPPSMVYRADKVGGFVNGATALQLIGGQELGGQIMGSPACTYIGASGWPARTIDPIVGIIGGTIRYAGGGWRPTFHSQAVDYLGTPVRPLRINEMLVAPYGAQGRFQVRELSRGITFADSRRLGPT